MKEEILALLQHIISIPSISKKEDEVADFLFAYLKDKGYDPGRVKNNIWVKNKHFSPSLPTILLNSHLDTVKPCDGWDTDPHSPVIKDNKLFGLGSNDAGLPLVSLLYAFSHFYDKNNLKFNLIFSATAEEEISGKNGIQCILPELGIIELGIIGEPTSLKMAIAEKGLLVLDCYSYGEAGHAAYDNENNAILNCIDDLQWFKSYKFEKDSILLGSTRATITQIKSGTQHNVVPDKSHFVVDVRVNDKYSNQEVLKIIKKHVKCEVVERSLRLNSSTIALDHPIVKKGKKLGLETFGSHTLSDQALLEFPSIKIGPGDSERSHIANEYIQINEIEKGIKTYIELITGLKLM